MGAERGHSGGAAKRSQIALEFMIVYSIILVIFVIVFAVIASERSVSLAQQQSVLMQLIAQSVAGYINQALQAGSGYTITAPLSAGIGYISYNISVSTTGLVLASTTVGKETITGEAQSVARNLAINGTLVASANSINLYVLPSYAGYLYISNAGGIIYVDQPTLSLPSLAENMSLFQQASINAPHFMAASNSVALVANSPTLKVANSITLDAWVYMSSVESYPGQVNVANPIVGEFGHSSQPFMLAVTNYGTPSFVTNDGNHMLQGSTSLSPNIWYNIAATYNSSSGSAIIYINGNSVAANSFTLGGFQGPSNLTIGGAPANGTHLNGYISDVQVYNASLSQQQIALLYTNGPSSAPANLVNRLVGWWPLNGNFNDYSGNGNTGTPYNAQLTPVVALQAKVSSFGGYPLPGVPIGFWSQNDLLGGSNSIAITTGSNGAQGTLLISNGISGRFKAESIYFNGNLTAEYKLLGWWPLDIGSSNTVYDYSGRSLSGTFANGAYGYLPNESATLTAQFNGASSSVSIANTSGLNPTSITIAAWFDPSAPQTSDRKVVAKYNAGNNGNDYDLHYTTSSCNLGGRLTTASGTASYGVSAPSCALNTWYFGAMTYQPSTNTISIYLDGQLVGTSSSTAYGALSSSSNPLTIGYSSFGPTRWVGNISNVQIYNTTLSAGQVAQLYSEGITGTPAPNKGLVGWWPMAGSDANYAALASPYSITSTNVGYNSVIYSSAYGAQNTTLFPLFNGVNSIVTLQSGALPNNCLANVTETAWVYDTGIPSSTTGGVINFSSGSSSFFSMRMNNNNVVYGAGSSSTVATASTAQSLKDTWTFLAARVSSGGAFSGFINGLQAATASGMSCLTLTSGKFGYVGTGYFNGSIVDVQIYNKSLSNGQVEQLYQQGFPAPTVTNASIG